MNYKNLFIKTKYSISTKQKVINISLVILILTSILIYSFLKIDYSINFNELFSYTPKILKGIGITIFISFISLILSLIIEIVLIIFQNSKFLPLFYLSKIYILAIRNTPLLVQIFLLFYVLESAFNLEDRYIMFPIILSIFSGAYITEILRSSLNSIDNRQIETCKSLGITKFQTFFI